VILDRILFRSHLHPHEKLLYVVHSHWFAVYKKAVKVSFFGLLVPALFFFMFPTEVSLYVFGIWFVMGFFRFFYEITDWYFDVLLVTNHGVIALDWNGFFDKSSSRVDFESISGVEYEKHGILANLFDFGHLVLGAEGDSELSLHKAASPKEAEEQVMHAREKFFEEKGLKDEKVLKQILSGMVKHHVREESEKHHGLADLL
jgi:hypothetical protein